MNEKKDGEQFESKLVTRKTVISCLVALVLSVSITIAAACGYCTSVLTMLEITNKVTGQTCNYNCGTVPACAIAVVNTTCYYPDPKTYVVATCTADWPCSGSVTASFANCSTSTGCGG
jgi:hypothetical protein